MTIKQFDISGFTGIEARNAMKVEVNQGDDFSVNIEADTEIIEEVKVILAGDMLKAKFETRLGHIGLLFKQVAAPKLIITMPELKYLELAAGTRGKIKGFKEVECFHAVLAGASKLNGDVDCRSIKLDGGAASFFELSGHADIADIELTGTSHASLEKFTAGDTKVKLHGASSLTLEINGKLDADIAGASSLRWKGAPVMGDIKVTGASSLNRK